MTSHTILLVFLGGGLGSVSRYVITVSSGKLRMAGVLPWGDFPWGTLLVNIIGSFILGFLAMFYRHQILDDYENLSIKKVWENTYIPLFFIGFCGGFTTFSSYMLDIYKELAKGLFLRAVLLLVLHLALGLLAVLLGGLFAWLTREGKLFS